MQHMATSVCSNMTKFYKMRDYGFKSYLIFANHTFLSLLCYKLFSCVMISTQGCSVSWFGLGWGWWGVKKFA